MTERTIKVVIVSVGSVKGYSRHEVRVVECRVDQRGHNNERDVKVWYRSQPLYRVTTKSGRGVGPQTVAYAKKFAEEKAREIMGI